MTLRYLKIGALAAALAGPWTVPGAVAQDGLCIPTFVYRTGAFAPNGIPIADGFKDYFTLLNERDGGIEGVRIIHEECETNYDTKLGVECYERLKSRNPLVINPFSTGITYASASMNLRHFTSAPSAQCMPHSRQPLWGRRLKSSNEAESGSGGK